VVLSALAITEQVNSNTMVIANAKMFLFSTIRFILEPPVSKSLRDWLNIQEVFHNQVIADQWGEDYYERVTAA
jgi:hypothetical protein